MKLDDETDGEVIYVPDTFKAETGALLTEDLLVSKELAGGAQGVIYELNGPDGSETKKLLKVLKMKTVTAAIGAEVGLKREWLIGVRLNKLRGPDGELEGFMGTGAALMRRDGGVEGLVLEKVNGLPLDKRLWKDEKWADASYTMALLKQVFSSLDRAYLALGYVHRDMRISNIMEHRGSTPYIPKGYKKEDKKKKKNQKPVMLLRGDSRPRELVFKIIDNGHARLLGAGHILPEAALIEKIYRRFFKGKGDVWRLLQDLSDAIDGRTWASEAEEDVKLILALIETVTGVKLNAYFAPVSGNGDVAEGLSSQGFMWQRADGFGHAVRRFVIRIRAYLWPRQTQYTPRQALDFLEAQRPVVKARVEERRQEHRESYHGGGRTL
ncbi:hypothetical protein WJX81_006835 [Elliptochloris bilobata]|uniref:Protein kinase domain-containing protein n=1 Tax=Elliptochloris bilobata TaxID=381761 RepID=A0AAW1S4G2_9CHLO